MSRWYWQQTFMLLTISVVLISIAGCARYWYQPGKSFEQCKRDKAQCNEELHKRSPDPSPDYRKKFIDNCMREKGYNLYTEDNLPLEAKREDSNSTNYWTATGVAGQIDNK